ncbi:hypothetical protein GMDG_00791 [Pseudogymnoascus destructans 20631-21]|uniref:Uncharacterized protein n=1 Tax=Pseudogymnoascus destructans (strain ATCC MYA-4855 / 20631-21) TaxID=658429 RepID=L8GCH3_PSED2|nr:hypothetical protein GMDG_00791 [Pseudogymnoascus destructans 20631-21]
MLTPLSTIPSHHHHHRHSHHHHRPQPSHPHHSRTTEMISRPRVIARNLPILTLTPIRPPSITTRPFHPRTIKLHRRRTALHEVIAHIQTRQDLLIRSRLHYCIDRRIPARVEVPNCLAGRQEIRILKHRRVGEGLHHVPRLQPGVATAVILAPRDRDAAEPGFIRFRAVVAVADQTVLAGVRDFAGDLLQGFGEVGVGGFGGVVVEGGEGGEGWERGGVAGDGVRDIGAEREVEEDRAVAVCGGG